VSCDYPADEVLDKLVHWDYKDPEGALLYASENWNVHYGLVIRNLNKTWSFVTGGWSGNEDIINSLADNILLWDTVWESCHRGGKWIFQVRS
jgi:hypothetical protein